MPTTNPPLKYLFTAQFKDGTEIRQTPDDESQTTTGKNCFYEVLQRLSEVSKFFIEGDGSRYMVDLSDGNFYIMAINADGLLKNVGHFAFAHGPIENMRLVYFIRNFVDFEVAPGNPEKAPKKMKHDRIWRIGWQGNKPDGENVQNIMEIE